LTFPSEDLANYWLRFKGEDGAAGTDARCHQAGEVADVCAGVDTAIAEQNESEDDLGDRHFMYTRPRDAATEMLGGNAFERKSPGQLDDWSRLTADPHPLH
jgi:hypothetical protein